MLVLVFVVVVLCRCGCGCGCWCPWLTKHRYGGEAHPWIQFSHAHPSQVNPPSDEKPGLGPDDLPPRVLTTQFFFYSPNQLPLNPISVEDPLQL